MALRNIVTVGDPVLNKTCRKVTLFDRRLHELLDDMADTLEEANGVGLAAPQVGVLRRAVLVDDVEGDLGVIELINPEITHSEGEQTDAEGCLSVPGEYGIVTRPQKVTVRAQTRHGKWFELEAEGLLARAVCHELDHLEGHLYTEIAERMLSKEELEELAQKNEAESDT